MHLKLLLFGCVAICLVRGSPRREKFLEEAASSNYVLIGNSQDSHDKNHRGFTPSYPLVLHTRPSSDYHSAYGQNGFNYNVPVIQNPPTSLISANVHLLEPFLLVTFLMFVLSLLDKAKIPALPRSDFTKELQSNDTNFDFNRRQFLQMLAGRNKTVF